MELSSSAATGAMRVGVQVVSAHKTPELEIYHQVRNTLGPEQEYQDPSDSSGNHKKTIKHRRHEVFIEFILLNIGGSRAENVKLSLLGNLKRNPPRDSFGELFDVIIPQMPPGQSRYLFKFDMFDLYNYSDNGSPNNFKTGSLTIVMEYDSGKGFLNYIFSLPSKFMRRRRFKKEYTFSPDLVSGDLPPIEYT